MSEQEPAPAGDGSAGNETADEIARSLGSVWQRFSGQRPKSTTVEIERNAVKCVIEEGAADPDTDEVAETADGAEANLSTDSAGFGYNATAVITRATGRRVVAFIPKHDKKTQTSTQTFILDQPRQRF
jgi:hypothetical protein